MEQRTTEQTRTRTEQKLRPTDRESRTPERDRLETAAQAARLVLAGLAPEELEPRRLEDLAAVMGNSAMAALMAARYEEPAQTSFLMPPEETGTPPCPVPETAPETAQPMALTAQMPVLRAFDPAGLSQQYTDG